MSAPAAVYRPRNSQDSEYYRCVEDPSVIREILEHLGLWMTKARPPPKIHISWRDDAGRELVELCPQECAAHDLRLQTHADTIFGDPEYSWDAYIHA